MCPHKNPLPEEQWIRLLALAKTGEYKLEDLAKRFGINRTTLNNRLAMERKNEQH